MIVHIIGTPLLEYNFLKIFDTRLKPTITTETPALYFALSLIYITPTMSQLLTLFTLCALKELTLLLASRRLK